MSTVVKDATAKLTKSWKSATYLFEISQKMIQRNVLRYFFILANSAIPKFVNRLIPTHPSKLKPEYSILYAI